MSGHIVKTDVNTYNSSMLIKENKSKQKQKPYVSTKSFGPLSGLGAHPLLPP